MTENNFSTGGENWEGGVAMRDGVYDRVWSELDGQERSRRYLIKNDRVLALRQRQWRPLSFWNTMAGEWHRVGDINLGGASRESL